MECEALVEVGIVGISAGRETGSVYGELSGSSAPGACGKPTSSSPLVEFLFFHKAIRAELGRLHQDALALEKGSGADILVLENRYHFVRAIYKYHSRAEDEVIFPALDLRVKNVAHAYTLEHQGESDLFEQMLLLLKTALKDVESIPMELRRELICCTGAIQTTLCQHFSKEEEQVLPLLMKHFSFEEQADLVWQFLCSIPVNLMEKFLPWLATSLTQEERQQMTSSLEQIVPEEQLLQEVVFAWLEGGRNLLQERSANVVTLPTTNSDHVGCERPSQKAIIEEHPPHVAIRMLEDVDKGFRKRCEPDIGQDLTARGLSGRSSPQLPIDEVLYWHNAIRKELREFAEELLRIQISGILPPANFVDRLKFLADVCMFHSTAEEKVLFPAVSEKVQMKFCHAVEEDREEQYIEELRRLVEGLEAAGSGSPVPSDLYVKLCAQAEITAKSIRQHLHNEETKVLPLARKHFSVEEQRTLLYQSLRVMPLKLLERVLPWLVGKLTENEARDMFRNLQLAAPVKDKALVTLFTGWACKGHPRRVSCISPKECPLRNLKGNGADRCSSEKQVVKDSFDVSQKRPMKRLRGSKREQEPIRDKSGKDVAEASGCPSQGLECCVPGLGCSRVGPKSSGTSLRSCSPLISGSGLFGWGSSVGGLGSGPSPKPIDHIFQFHKAIRKDLEYLDAESAHLANCTEEFVRHFSGRFQFLWGLYRAHSNAEDDIVFPALEAKEALHNVSHSYTIDHKQEEQLLKDISDVLQELSLLHSPVYGNGSPPQDSPTEDTLCSEDIAGQRLHLAGKLQRMCKSARVSLDQHVSREELELWPLFEVHFTIDEQDKIVGQIIGTTGAEVLQAMLPWVTTALTEQEQSTMLNTWRQATRNTMFDKWLSAWWEDASSANSQLLSPPGDATPPSGSDESLQIVADYLGNGGSKSGISGLVISASQNALQNEGEGENCESSCIEVEKANGSPGQVHNEGFEMKGSVKDEEDTRKCVGDDSDTFKPGWRDIFRMNQKELEAAIRKVSRDSSLDPRRKAYLIQNLMTSRWIVAQQRLSMDKEDQRAVGSKDPELCVSFNNESERVYGCEHYSRNCKIKAACCGLLTTCRFCHDKVSDHTMDRHATKEMMCMKCLQVQPVAQQCATIECDGYQLAKYYCNICKFFNNDDREIYHCPFCNLCRVGKGLGQDYFHCMTCNVCMSVALIDHKCREKGLESDCPICHDFLFTSSTPVKALPCGHFMHSACFKAYSHSNYTCPICSKSVGDMAVFFGMLDALLAAEQLPVEYHNRPQEILCNDCGRKGTAQFHWLYHKCDFCRSYNTRTI